MIVCSCNRLSAEQIVETLSTEEAHNPRSPVEAYRCLGCKPDCGRCLVSVRALLAEHRVACAVGCATCPGADGSEQVVHLRPRRLAHAA